MLNSNQYKQNLLQYFESLRNKEKHYGVYHYKKGLPDTIWSSAYVALTRSLIGELEYISQEDRSEWLSYLENSQDPETGLFLEPTMTKESMTSKIHTAQLAKWHGSTFVNGAIHVLGGDLKYPVSDINFLKEKGKMTAYLDSLPWEDPWLAGNYTYDIGCLLGFDYRVTEDIHNLDAMDEFFLWHNKYQKNDTGFWNPTEKGSLAQELYGGYHSLMVYWMFDKEVLLPDKMIKSALNVYQQNGSSTGCCQDMDIFDTAISLYRQYGMMDYEIRKAAEDILPSLLDKLNPDGGFCNDRKNTFSDLGWTNHMVGIGESALTCTYFNTFTLSLMEEILELGLQDAGFRHMDTYCHGIRPKCLL
ncbi:MAG: hypothetical protein JXQ23_13365 [Clostridia bacterium]|nr:hypothetical protein [Clostridia bacterium]